VSYVPRDDALKKQQRDSLYDEEIVWSGTPKTLSVPFTFKVAGAVSALMAVVAIAFAVVIAKGLGQPVGSLLAFGAWCATIALVAWRFPLWWRAPVTYLVTEKHVIWQRGRYRRTIDRAAITYAIIKWNDSVPGVGDLVLERAVPIGALRRTLSVTLADVEAPDRLWAIVRGLVPSDSAGDGSRPLAQRLDDGERVIWTSHPLASRWTARRFATAVGATLLGASAAWVFVRSWKPLAKIVRAHLLSPFTSGMLVGAVALVVLLLVVLAVWIGYASVLRPVLLARATRYFVTDRRVLIRRGSEELHLDRQRIAYVITSPFREGSSRRDVFLVLDGPQARAFAPSGAFHGPDEQRLVPMFAAIEDADAATDALHVSRISITEARQAA
jgi:hypothetical protein